MNDLVYAAKEMNKVLGLIPRIRCFDDGEQLIMKIKSVSELVLKDQQMFSERTVKVVKRITKTKERKRKPYTSASHFVIR